MSVAHAAKSKVTKKSVLHFFCLLNIQESLWDGTLWLHKGTAPTTRCWSLPLRLTAALYSARFPPEARFPGPNQYLHVELLELPTWSRLRWQRLNSNSPDGSHREKSCDRNSCSVIAYMGRQEILFCSVQFSSVRKLSGVRFSWTTQGYCERTLSLFPKHLEGQTTLRKWGFVEEAGTWFPSNVLFSEDLHSFCRHRGSIMQGCSTGV